jgi:hypothetical protein
MGKEPDRARVGRALSEDEEAVQPVGVRDEVSTVPPALDAEVPLDDSGFVVFAVTGTQVSGEFRCADCGYGAVVHRDLPQCPMCGGTVWESREPLARRIVDQRVD